MPTSAKRIAILDDDESFQDYLKTLFELRGHKVRPYSTPGSFLDGAARFKPDLIVLDLHLPNVDGWQFLKTLKGLDAFKGVPVVLVTGVRRRAPDVVAGFEQGADEYLTKPVQGEVMVARVEALLRRYGWRSQPETGDDIRFGTIVVSPARRETSVGGKPVKLSRLEFDLLVFFIEHPDRVHTRAALKEAVWKAAAETSGRGVDKYVEYLRKKLGPVGEKLETVVGVGYMLRSN